MMLMMLAFSMNEENDIENANKQKPSKKKNSNRKIYLFTI